MGPRAGADKIKSEEYHLRVVRSESIHVSEEHIASIFRVEKIIRARNQRESKQSDPEDGGDMFLRNVG
jgi:hypothetical protein